MPSCERWEGPTPEDLARDLARLQAENIALRSRLWAAFHREEREAGDGDEAASAKADARVAEVLRCSREAHARFGPGGPGSAVEPLTPEGADDGTAEVVLSPCPFCGSTNTAYKSSETERGLVMAGYVVCGGCSAFGPEVDAPRPWRSAEDQGGLKRAAAEAWNRGHEGCRGQAEPVAAPTDPGPPVPSGRVVEVGAGAANGQRLFGFDPVPDVGGAAPATLSPSTFRFVVDDGMDRVDVVRVARSVVATFPPGEADQADEMCGELNRAAEAAGLPVPPAECVSPGAMLREAKRLAGSAGQVFYRPNPADTSGWVYSVRGVSPVALSRYTAARAAAEGIPDVTEALTACQGLEPKGPPL